MAAPTDGAPKTGKRKISESESASIAMSRPRRAAKPVDRYEPSEICNDDYADEDYDSDDSDMELRDS